MKCGKGFVGLTIMVALAAACSTSSSTDTTSSGTIGASVSTYDGLTADVATAVGHYRDEMAGAGMTSIADCNNMHDRDTLG